MSNKPGYYQGRHYSDYDKELRTLAKAKQTTALEALLLHLLDAIEAESQTEKIGIPPGYYDELAELYHIQYNYTAEIALYERFFKQIQLPNVNREGLRKRLQSMNEAKRLLREEAKTKKG